MPSLAFAASGLPQNLSITFPNRLIASKFSQLERAVPELKDEFPRAATVQDFAETAGASTAARVVVYTPLAPNLLAVVGDSLRPANSSDVGEDPIALRAQATLDDQRGTVVRHGARYAEVAMPTSSQGGVILLTASLAPQFQTINVVKRRFVIAGIVALGFAFAVGYGGAWAFARRIRRLERAAERIAAGKFDKPVVDRSKDELGELSRAFDRMRTRLAHLDDARREFVANASHELRTPLFALGGFLELMDDEDLDDATRAEFVTAMREQVARLTRLATDLLDLSRLDAGRIRVERRDVDLSALAQAVVEEFRPVAHAKDHPLELTSANDTSAIGDPERVLQIGRLLVENAIVHTPPGTAVRLRVATENGRATLEVEDEGPGVAPGDVEHVFDRFYRADGGRSSGSGLGLAIARELAELMEGRVDLVSRPGRTAPHLGQTCPTSPTSG